SRNGMLTDVLLLDAEYYDRKAREIAAGDWLSGREVFTMSPLYPYFLAAIYSVAGGSVAAARFRQHVLGGATCGRLARVGIRLAGPAAGVVSGMVAATYGLLVFSESTLENEFLVLFLNTLATWLLLNPDRTGWRWRTIAAGSCLGASVLVRPNAMLLIIPVA